MIDRLTAAVASTWGKNGGGSKATEESLRGEFGEDGWVPCGGEAPLSQRFSDREVLSSARSVGST